MKAPFSEFKTITGIVCLILLGILLSKIDVATSKKSSSSIEKRVQQLEQIHGITNGIVSTNKPSGTNTP